MTTTAVSPQSSICLNRRIYISLLLGLTSFVLMVIHHATTVGAINDMYFPTCGAAALLRGIDPWGSACIIEWEGKLYPPNPMTTVLIALPFVFLFDGLAHFLMWGVINGLLAFGLLRTGKWWHLLLFTSPAYWWAFLTLQWSPLMAAILLLPSLIPLTLIKPHIGLPVALLHLQDWRHHRWAITATIIFGLSTFAIDPTWLSRWWPQTQTYDGHVPMLTLPLGPLLLLSGWVWWQRRDRSSLFVLLMAVVPQRQIYDLTALWLLPRSPRQMLLLSGIGWIAWLLTGGPRQPLLLVLFYLFALSIVWWNEHGVAPLDIGHGQHIVSPSPQLTVTSATSE